ncbi:MAG: hypothetical protein IT204_02800 [Fimbriimonadaceae bacterium]|nr:hypothetical protein [Fimbriimonadaceae bacterium]
MRKLLLVLAAAMFLGATGVVAQSMRCGGDKPCCTCCTDCKACCGDKCDCAAGCKCSGCKSG